jgi:hypothetical protein
MSTAYGYDIKTKTDAFVRVGEDAMQRLASAMIPGATLVNTIPMLQYLPPWFPGTGFHELASETRKLTTQMKEVPFKWTQDNMVIGHIYICRRHSHSFLYKHLESGGRGQQHGCCPITFL